MKISGILLCACALAVAWAGAGSLVQQAPEKAARMADPRAGDPDAWRAGAKLYERECAECHGAQRQGGQKAPPLTGPDITEAAPGSLFWVLRNGALHRGMPSFAHLPEPQRWQIITFLSETGATQPAPVNRTGRRRPTGTTAARNRSGSGAN